jgi:hypothetical protein
MSTAATPHLFWTRDAHRLHAVVSALAATLAIWLIAHVLAGVDLTVRSGAGDTTQSVGPAAVALATVLGCLAACGLLMVLERVAARPRMTWNVIAYTTLAISLAGPIGFGQTDEAIATLTCMHLAVAGVLIPALARSTRRG